MDDSNNQHPRSEDTQRSELLQSVLGGTVYEPSGGDDNRTAIRVPAKLIMDLNELYGAELAGRTLRIRYAEIAGHLEFIRRKVWFNLSITESVFTESPSFDYGHFQSLDFRGCAIPALKIHEARVEGEANFEKAQLSEDFIVTNTRFSKSVLLSRIQVPGEMRFEDVHVGSDIRINNSLINGSLQFRSVMSSGTLDLKDTRIGAAASTSLKLTGCYFANADFRGLDSIGDIAFDNSFAREARLPEGHLRAVGPDLPSHFDSLHPVELGLMSVENSVNDRSLAVNYFDRRLKTSRLHALSWSLLTVGLLFGAFLITSHVLSRTTYQPTVGDGSMVSVAPFSALTVAVFAGVLSCCTIEVAKRVLRLRGLYHWVSFRNWLVSRLGVNGAEKARRDFIGLLSGEGNTGSRMLQLRISREGHNIFRYLRFFDIPIEQFAAQLANISDEVLKKPGNHEQLFRALVGDVKSPSDLSDERLPDIGQKLNMSVDQMQIALGGGWRRALAIGSVAVSGVWGLLFIYLYENDITDAGLSLVASLFVGAFVSWLLRDLAASVENFRR